jgi:hypothetical protein
MDHLVEPRETHLRFEFDASGPQDAGSLCRRSRRGGIKEYRLANARGSGHQQAPATDGSTCDERIKLLELGVATEQSHRRFPSR